MKALDTALRNTLTGGTALTALLSGTASVYADVVPPEESFPCVVYQDQGGGDENLSPHRTKSVLRTVKAISATSKVAAEDIDAQIDALLHDAPFAVTGWSHIWCMREADISYTETNPEGRAYFHVGGVYRMRLAQ